MYKKIIFFLCMFLIVISISFAIDEVDWFGCNDNLESEGTNNNDMTEEGDIVFSETRKEGTKSCFFESGDYALDSSASFNTGNNFWSINLWLYLTELPEEGTSMRFYEMGTKGSNQQSISFYYYRVSGIYYLRVDLYNDVVALAYTLPTTGYNMLTWNYNINKSTCFYLNTSLLGCGTHSNTLNLVNGTASFGARMDNGLSSILNGYLDNIRLYNEMLNSTHLELLYNSGSSTSESLDDLLTGEEPPPTPVLNLYTNLENFTTNYNETYFELWFNTTTSYTSENSSCSIYIDENLNQSYNNINSSLNTNFNLSFGYVEKWFNVSMNCSTNNATDNSGYFYFNVDTIEPHIESDFINNTVFNVSDVLRIYFNVTDTNTFAYEMNITDLDNDVWLNVFASNLTGGFYENLTEYVLTALEISNHTLLITAYDSHHIKGMKLKYKASVENNILIYDNVNFYCENIKEMNFIQEDYKIKGNPKFKDKSKNFTCFYESSNFVYIEDEFLNHYVDIYSEKWIDENIENVESINLGNGKVQFNFYFEEEIDSFFTNSIGDLHKSQIIYKFVVQEQPTLSDVYLLEIRNQLITLNDTNDSIGEGINMLWIIIFIGIFLIIGFLIRVYIMWSIGAFGFGLIFLSMGTKAIEKSGEVFYVAGMWGSLVLGIVLFFIGVALQIITYIENGKDKGNFYDSFYD